MKNSVNVKDRILDISVNLARVANWAADSYEQKKHLINFFLDQTEGYIKEIRQSKMSKDFEPIFTKFIQEFKKLKSTEIQKDNDWWSECALTWANILTHRAKLA